METGHAARKRSLTRHACGLTQAHCLINPLDRRDLRQGVPTQQPLLKRPVIAAGRRARPAQPGPSLHEMREMQDQMADIVEILQADSVPLFGKPKTRPLFIGIVAAWSAAAQSFSGLAGPGKTRQRPSRYISEGGSSASARIVVLRCSFTASRNRVRPPSHRPARGGDERVERLVGSFVVDVCRRAMQSPTPGLY